MSRGVLFAYKVVPLDPEITDPDEAEAAAIASVRDELTEELLRQNATRDEILGGRWRTRASQDPDEVVVVAAVIVHR